MTKMGLWAWLREKWPKVIIMAVVVPIALGVLDLRARVAKLEVMTGDTEQRVGRMLDVISDIEIQK